MASESNCLTQDLLIGLLQDSLSKEEQLRAAEHVQTCQFCQKELETICEQRKIELPETTSVDSEKSQGSVAEWSGKLAQKLMAELQQDGPSVTNPESVDPPSMATIISTEENPSATEQTVERGAVDSETSVTKQHAANADSPTELHIAEMFGRYKVEKILGQGAMGAVYLARDTQLDRDVALKIPKFGSGNNVDDQELLERFYREARAAATLRSPYICPVHDVGEIDGQHYITMAYIEGRPLKDFTKSKKKHSEKQIATTVRKLAQGLSEAHEIGVVHRDLKPANVMVDKKGEPVVMDFGLARRSSSDDVQVTQSGAIMGTPAYMSPEQVEGDQDKIGPQADIYALGIIMYELITGEMPYKGSLMSILQQIALNNPEKPSKLRPDLDPRLEKICLKMMAGDLAKRYQSMEEVAADLQEVMRTPRKKNKQQTSANPSPKQTSIPTATEESNPALISIAPQSITEQLREKRGASKSKRQTSSGSSSSGGNKNVLIAGGVIGLLLLTGIVFLVRVGKYDVQITLDDPSITLSVDNNKLNIKDGKNVIQLSAGPHKLQLEKDGLQTQVEEFTVTKDGKTALTAKVVNGKLDAVLGGESVPAMNGRNVVNNQPVVKRADYDKLATGTWKPLSGNKEIIVDKNNPGSQYGAGFQWFPETVERDVLARAKVKMIDAVSVGIHVRTTPNPSRELSYVGEYNHQTSMCGIFVVNSDYRELKNKQIFNAAVYDHKFFEIAVAAVGSRLSVYIDGQQVIETTDNAFSEGYIGLFAFEGSAIFKDVEVMSLDDASNASLASGATGSASAPPPASAPFDANQAKAHQKAWADYIGVPVEYTNSIGMKFRLIPPGEFLMGSTPEEIKAAIEKIVLPGESRWEQCFNSEGPRHKVILTHPIYVGATEVTQSQYEQIMRTNPSHFSATGEGKDLVIGLDTSNYPVETVSWNDAAEFCAKLSQHEKLKPFYVRSGETVMPLDGTGYRLPTEAEWELACRAGTLTRFWSGDKDDDLVGVGWFESNSDGRTHAVGQKKANPFGLADVHGNVWEWVQDSWDSAIYEKFQEDLAIDPTSPFSSNSQRTFRSGAWNHSPTYCRSSIRSAAANSTLGFSNRGFRVVLSVEAVKRATSTSSGPTDASAGSFSSTYPGKFALSFPEREESYVEVATLDSKLMDSLLRDKKMNLTIEFWLKRDQNKISPHDHYAGWSDSYLFVRSAAGSEYVDGGEWGGRGAPPVGFYDTVAPTRTLKNEAVWTHVAAVLINPTEYRLFMDGKLVDTKPAEWDWPGSVDPFQLMAQAAGMMGETRVSTTARYDKDFTPEFGFQPDEHTLALYHFDEGSGDILKDSSGNGHDGKIIGAKWVRFGNGKVSNTVPDPPDQSEKIRWPLEPTRPEDIAWLQTLDASLTLRTGVDQEIDLRPDGKLPDRPATIVGVRFSDLSTEKVTDDVLKRLSTLIDIEILGLNFGRSFAPATKDGLAHLVALENLQALHLERIGPVDTDPAFLTALPRLKRLGISHQPAFPWERGVTRSSSLEEIRLHKVLPDDWKPFAQMSRLKSLSLTGSPNDRTEREAAAKHFATIAPWCRILVFDSVVTGGEAFTIEPTAPLPGAVMRQGSEDAPLPAGSTITSDDGSVELLSLIKYPDDAGPSADGDPGKMETQDDGVLFSRGALARVPVVVDSDKYEIECEFTPQNDFQLLLPVGEMLQMLDVQRDHSLFHINGAGAVGTPRGEHPSIAGKRKKVRVLVDLSQASPRFTVDLNGQKIIEFEPAATSMRDIRDSWVKDRWNIDKLKAAGSLAIIPNGATIHSFKIKLHEGEAKLLRSGDSESVMPGATAGLPSSEDAPLPAVAPFDEAQAKAHQQAWAKHLNEPVVTTNSIGMQLAVIPPGRFKMDNAVDVTLTKPLRFGIHEVTQGQWKSVMGAEPWKGQENVREGKNFPATYMDWTEATEFCRNLTERERAAGKLGEGWEYRLPTEAEWEYACRAGTTTTYSVDDESLLGEYAWFDSNSKRAGEEHAHEVGLKKPNPWGLHDVHGNVRECCSDWYVEALRGGTDPTGPAEESTFRVFKGGAWHFPHQDSGSAIRHAHYPDHRSHYTGLRVALSPTGNAEQVSSSTRQSTNAPPPAVAPFDEAQAKAHQNAWADYLGEPIVTTNSIGTKLAVIPPGTFKMGEGENAVDVTLTRPMQLGVYEVTQREWKAVMGTEPWNGQKETQVGDDVAATFVNWPDAAEFCQKLTQRERTAGTLREGWEYRLPTQAEWEFALRSGTTGEWAFADGKNIGDYGWSDENAKNVGEAHAHGVGQKKPSPWGLYDLHGNVWEWCSDWNSNDLQGGVDPQGPSQGSARAHRGGSWHDGAWYARSPVRHGAHETARDPYRGFRLALAPAAGTPITKVESSR